jgi:hypothetical protein
LDGKSLLCHSKDKHLIALKYRMPGKNSCLSNKKIVVAVPHEYIDTGDRNAFCKEGRIQFEKL